jgi:hypothetical protein
MQASVSIEPTTRVIEVNGVRCRVWTGTLPSGEPVQFFVHGVLAVPGSKAARELEEILAGLGPVMVANLFPATLKIH